MSEPDERPDLTAVKVFLTDRTWRALEDATGLTQDSKTDTINAAIQMYCLLLTYKSIDYKIFIGRSRLSSGELHWNWREGVDG